MADSSLFPDLNSASGTQGNAQSNGPAQAEQTLASVEPVAPVAPVIAPPAVPAEPAAPVPDLFGNAPAIDAMAPNSGMVEAVVSNDNKAEVLGPKPKTQGGEEIRAPRRFNFGGFLLKLGIFAGLAVYGFFTIQLSPTFQVFGKTNPVQRLEVLKGSFAEEQTTINLYHLLMAKFALDDFSLTADRYLLTWSEYQSSFTEKETKDDMSVALAKLQSDMQTSLSKAKDYLAQPLYPAFVITPGESIGDLENHYKQLLRDRLTEEKRPLLSKQDDASRIERSNLDSALALLSDDGFRNEIRTFNFENNFNPEIIESIFKKNTAISKNQFSTILSLKSQQVDWVGMLNELQRSTKEIDPLYGSGIAGNIQYSNVAFNASDRSVTLRGQTRTDDALNFSLLSDLIDALESSTSFTSVANRNFSKVDAAEVGTTASFNLNFALQEGNDARDRSGFAMSNEPQGAGVPLHTAAPEDNAEEPVDSVDAVDSAVVEAPAAPAPPPRRSTRGSAPSAADEAPQEPSNVVPAPEAFSPFTVNIFAPFEGLNQWFVQRFSDQNSHVIESQSTSYSESQPRARVPRIAY